MKTIKAFFVMIFLFSVVMANPCSVRFNACESHAWGQTFNDATGEFNASAYSIALSSCTAGLLACADALLHQ